MNNVVPYDINISKSDGGFIKPDGEFVFTPNTHELYAINYCHGSDWLYPHKRKDKNNSFSLSKLTEEDLFLYKEWLKAKQHGGRNVNADFLVHVLGYDKVETCLRRLITTTSNIPHIRFYNYYLMGWNVCKLRKEKFDKNTGMFVIDYADNLSPILMHKERKAEAEIEEISQKVLFKDRDKFFRTDF